MDDQGTLCKVKNNNSWSYLTNWFCLAKKLFIKNMTLGCLVPSQCKFYFFIKTVRLRLCSKDNKMQQKQKCSNKLTRANGRQRFIIVEQLCSHNVDSKTHFWRQNCLMINLKQFFRHRIKVFQIISKKQKLKLQIGSDTLDFQTNVYFYFAIPSKGTFSLKKFLI